MVERQAQAVRAQQSAVTLLLTILFARNPKQFAHYFSLDLLPCLPLSVAVWMGCHLDFFTINTPSTHLNTTPCHCIAHHCTASWHRDPSPNSFRALLAASHRSPCLNRERCPACARLLLASSQQHQQAQAAASERLLSKLLDQSLLDGMPRLARRASTW